MIGIKNPYRHKTGLEKSFIKPPYPKCSRISYLILNLLLTSSLLRNLLPRNLSLRVIFSDITKDVLKKTFWKDLAEMPRISIAGFMISRSRSVWSLNFLRFGLTFLCPVVKIFLSHSDTDILGVWSSIV